MYNDLTRNMENILIRLLVFRVFFPFKFSIVHSETLYSACVLRICLETWKWENFLHTFWYSILHGWMDTIWTLWPHDARYVAILWLLYSTNLMSASRMHLLKLHKISEIFDHLHAVWIVRELEDDMAAMELTVVQFSLNTLLAEAAVKWRTYFCSNNCCSGSDYSR